MNWLQSHIYIAAWASPIITLVGLIVRNTVRPSDKVNWSMVMVYVAFLTCLATVLTPGTDMRVWTMGATVGSIAFGYIMVDALWKR